MFITNDMYLLFCFFNVLPRAFYMCIQCGLIPSAVWKVSSSLQTSLPHFESGQQAWYYFIFWHTYLPISMWKTTIFFTQKVCSRVAPSSLDSSESVSTLGFLPPALVPLGLSKFLEDHITGQFRFLILVSPCWMETT